MQIVKRIIVLCTGNICRSPMAEAVMKHGLRDAVPPITVSSAGIGAMGGHFADAPAISLMDERGLNIHDHRGTQFTGQLGLQHDLILVMTTEQRQFVETNWPLLHGRVYRLGHWGAFDVDDPYQRGIQAFRKSLKAIDEGASRWLQIVAR